MGKDFSAVKALPALMVAALLSLAVSGALLLWREPAAANNAVSQPQVLPALAQSMAAEAARALGGNVAAFDELAAVRPRFERLSRDVSAQPDLAAQAQKLAQQSQRVLSARDAVLAAYSAGTQVDAEVTQLLQAIGNVAGTFTADKFEALKQTLQRFESTALGLQQDVVVMLAGVGDSAVLTRRLNESTAYLEQVIAELGGAGKSLGLPTVAGADAQQKLKAAANSNDILGERVRAVLAAAEQVQQAAVAAREMTTAAGSIATAGAEVSANSAAPPSGWRDRLPLIFVALSLAITAAIALIYASTANIRKAAEKQRLQNERNQAGILRLLDELSSLADGDLTVQATVTEDITGAIADSINYAIEALRELVTTINSTAITLDASAKQALASVAHLAKASVTQSKQVAAASESIVAMAATVEEVSGNAERSADVARHSVDVAHKGSDAVRRTIDGMNTIRETIQETSKRIKRLGESSQEIGNIVELINDIAEQTNILALNASIQASMAGEAGRGFAVVADEVQRLAERAANATKQIEVLVRTIQTDTNEAVVSMERSTTDVVGGALLAENAGAALEEIEQVSHQIASLVQNISGSARQQATTAQNIARNMQVLREISAQTAENSAATSTSVGKLAQLSGQMRKSVAGFRLPGAEHAAPPAPAKPGPAPPVEAVIKNVSAAAG